MKITLKTLMDKLSQTDYLQDMETVKYAEVSHAKSKLLPYAEKMLAELAVAIKRERLMQTQLVVTGMRPVTFSIELNIINLPYANYKKISNFCDETTDYEVNLYFETSSEHLNASHFRIDHFAPASEVLTNQAELAERLADEMLTKFQVIADNAKVAAEAAKAQPVTTEKVPKRGTKKAAKKTTKKGTKKTVKKTATKKRSTTKSKTTRKK
ncbi:MAG: hypothetical protein ACTIAG_01935 [Lactobacillus sp.]